MVNTPDFERFLGIPYDYKKGPTKQNRDQMRIGANCQLLFHVLLEEIYGVRLNEGTLSKEVFEDDETFKPLGYTLDPESGLYVIRDELVVGDVFLFGPQQITDPKRLHMAAFIGKFDKTGYPLLFHSNVVDKKSSIWNLEEFKEHERYSVLYAIKRYNATSYP